MASEEKRNSLPFEPQRKRAKKSKKSPSAAQQGTERPNKPSQPQGKDNLSAAIPEAVSKRMIRRMALFSGIPTGLGLSSFFLFYWIVQQGWFELPTVAVFATSAGLFGLGVIGLSYGVFSASWDENHLGSWLGFEEFKLNFGRAIAAWRDARKDAKTNS